MVVSKSQNRRVPVRKQPYAVRVQPPGQRKVPIPCPATGARGSPEVDPVGVDPVGVEPVDVDPVEAKAFDSVPAGLELV